VAVAAVTLHHPGGVSFSTPRGRPGSPRWRGSSTDCRRRGRC